MTSALRTLEAGADAIVEGPYGSFSHQIEAPGQIWIAGGIGVTPFLSMARSLGDNADAPPVDFYYCVEHRDEAHFLGEFQAIAARRRDFRVIVVPRDEEGFLTAERIAEESGDVSSRAVLICGPPAMIENLRSQLVAREAPTAQIHAEEFGFAKLGRKSPEPDRTPKLAPSTLEEAVDVQLRPRFTDAQVLATVAGLALAAGLVFAAGVVVGDRTASNEVDAPPSVPGAADEGSAAAGKSVFASAGCDDCHSLAAAASSASIGPNLDEAMPGARLVVDVVTNGSGAMPAFEGELTDREIRDVAAFVSSTAGR